MFDTRILLVGVGYGILIRLVGSNLCRKVFGNDSLDFVIILPFNVAPSVVEVSDYVREQVELRLGSMSSALRWRGVDLGILVSKLETPASPASPLGSYPCRWLRGYPSTSPPLQAQAA